MATDASILLQSRVAPVGNMLLQGYRAGSQMRQQREEAPLRNRLLTAQADGAEQQQQRGAMAQLNDEQRSIIAGAAELKPLIDAGDDQGALSALSQRRASLQRLGLNTTHTDEAIQMLQSGNRAGLKNSVDALYQAGMQSGVLREPDTGLADYRKQSLELQRDRMDMQRQDSAADRALREKQISIMGANGTENPAAVKEWEYYKKLPPEQQKQYDAMKRGDRVTAGTENNILKTADAAEAERVKFENYSDLATRYEQAANMSGGVGASLSEWVKAQTGDQDAYTALRKDWAGIKASQVVSNLPPGAASDADVKLALGGFLPDNAEPKQVAAFMRGIAKLSRIKGEFESFKSDYMSENRSTVGLNKAWKQHSADSGLHGPTTSSSQQQAPSNIDDLVNKYAD